MSWFDVLLQKPPKKPDAPPGGGTFTINPSAQSGYIESGSTEDDYAAARAGTGNILNHFPAADYWVGQYLFVDETTVYSVQKSFLDFDVSSITGTLSTATLSLALLSDESSQEFTVQARTRDWGPTLGTDDFVAGASLGGLTLLATLASSGIGALATYKAFTESGTNLRDAVTAARVGSGNLRMLLCSDRTVGNNPPSGNEYLTFSSYNHSTLKPKLVVVTT